MAKIAFTNPSNGFQEVYDTSVSPIWCLLFGCFYWLVRGNIAHAAISFVLATLTFGISWLVYPFFANKINIRSYMRKGWRQLYFTDMRTHTSEDPNFSASVSTKTFERISLPKSKRLKVPVPIIVVLGIIAGIIGFNYGRDISKQHRQETGESAIYSIMHRK